MKKILAVSLLTSLLCGGCARGRRLQPGYGRPC